MKTHNNVTGLILAGGLARRMGGTDKGLVALEGRPMIAYIIDALRLQVDSILINANRNISTYEEYGYNVISDDLEDFQGPLAGMATGLKHCKTDYIATVPCDGPVLADNYIDILIRAATQANSPISVGFDGNRLQPVYALIHRDLLSDLNQYLASGERKIDRWYAKHQFAKADFSSSLKMFTNINTPEDLESASELL
jgi:molybdenum cofactor guanylyltransferase|tara:strand:+ start:2642 stop:3232 length:591 start_codon:yes stop_codon:yes gene_type:complete